MTKTTTHRPQIALLLALAACAMTLLGCASRGAYHMRAARTAVSIGRAPEGQAQVVFAIPGRSREVVSIVDQRGTYYGQLRAETALVIDVPPGRYRFYAIRERNGYAVDVPALAAGRTAYIAGIDPLLTGFVWRSISGCDATAREARAGLERLALMEPDPSVPHATVIAEIGDIPRRTGEADSDLVAMSTEHRALRTVDAESLAHGGRCDGTAPAGTSGDEAPPAAE